MKPEKQTANWKGKHHGKIHVHSHHSARKVLGGATPPVRAAQQDQSVKGYRSFANLAEGKAMCVMEAANQDAIAAWFTKMGMPFDSITKVELEGERGNIQAA